MRACMRMSQASIKTTSSAAVKPNVCAIARQHRAGEAVARGARGSAAAGSCCGALYTELRSAARSRMPLYERTHGAGTSKTAAAAQRSARSTTRGTGKMGPARRH